MDYEGEIELVADHGGYRLLGTHTDCEVCLANAYTAYGFASSWGNSAHGHGSNDDEGTYHQGVARLITGG